jgi:6-phosphofructokinase
VVSAAAAAKYKLSVIHVPKSIFNDMPLGEGVRTFGFSTAREVGCQLVQNFANDARTMLRWYILVCMGQKAGHLTLGIGKAGAATVTIIAEDYLNRSTPLTFMELATVLEAAIYKVRKQTPREAARASDSPAAAGLNLRFDVCMHEAMWHLTSASFARFSAVVVVFSVVR